MIRVLQTSAHDLRGVEDGSIQLIATSPPFFGLRSYVGDQDVEWPTVTFRHNRWRRPQARPQGSRQRHQRRVSERACTKPDDRADGSAAVVVVCRKVTLFGNEIEVILNAMYPASDFLGTVEVPEGNDILYGQDHTFHRGIPAGRYSVYQFGAAGRKLVAPGYGLTGDYGNGALYVSDPANPIFAQLSQGVDEQHAPTSV